MAGTGLNHTVTGRRAGLALLLVLMVLSVCLSQQAGLTHACPAAVHETERQSPAHVDNGQALLGQPCELSGELLFTAWSLQDIALIGLLLLALLWPLIPCHHTFSLPFRLRLAGRRRRHLLFCVFRE